MTPDLFFDKFPIIEYDGYTTRNIMLRIAIARSIVNRVDAFYPFVIKEDMRPDQVADMYYGSPNYAPLVWLSNDIIDPFFQWPLTDAQLNRVIIKRYGDLQTARGTIAYYKHPTKMYHMTPTTYDNTDPDLLTDWTAVYAFDHEVAVNEARRSIKLVSVEYLPQINREIQTVLGPDSKRT